MKETNKKKQIAKISIFITSIFVILLSVTYAFMTEILIGTKKVTIAAGTLSLVLDEGNAITISDGLPMYDAVGMIQEEVFTFDLINETSNPTNYVLKLEDVETGTLAKSDVKYGLIKNGETSISLLSDLTDGIIDSGTIEGNQTNNYELRLWIKDSVTEISQIQNKFLKLRMSVDSSQKVVNDNSGGTGSGGSDDDSISSEGMKWYVSGDTSKINYLPELPSYDSNVYPYAYIRYTNYQDETESVHLYEFLVSNKEAIYRSDLGACIIPTSSKVQTYIYDETNGFVLYSSVDSLSVAEFLYVDEYDTYKLLYNNSDIYEYYYDNASGSIVKGLLQEPSGKIYDGDWEIFGHTGLPAIPDDVKQKYPYILLSRSVSDDSWFLECITQKTYEKFLINRVSEEFPFYEYSEVRNYTENCDIIVYGLINNQWYLLSSESGLTIYNDETSWEYGVYPYWASYEIPVYENGTHIDTVYQQYGKNGVIYDTYPGN